MGSSGASLKKAGKGESSKSNLSVKLAKTSILVGMRLKNRLRPIDIPDQVKNKYKNGASDWIGVLDDDPKPILYMSSIVGTTDWSDEIFVKATGNRFRCFSYFYCGYDSPKFHAKHSKGLDYCLGNDVRVFMDSGAHSFHRMLKGHSMTKHSAKQDRLKVVKDMADVYAEKYARYIRWCYATGRSFDFYVTLDSQKNCKVIWDTTKRLQKLGIYPVPVYHGDDSLDWVKRYADEGHKILGVGISGSGKTTNTARRAYYSSVFEIAEKAGIKLHGFAITGDLMFAFPWYSVDSSTYIKAAGYGKILDIMTDKQRVPQIHISRKYSEVTPYRNFEMLSPKVQSYWRERVAARGFDFDELRDSMTKRVIYNAKVLTDAVKGKILPAGEMYSKWTPLI